MLGAGCLPVSGRWAWLMLDHEGSRREAADGAAGGKDQRGRGQDDGAAGVRPAGVVSMLAEIGLRLAETKTQLAKWCIC